MKAAAEVVFACVAVVILAAGCNYTERVMYIDIANHSGHSMKNIELTHPSGVFGLPELRNEQTHRHLTPIASPCKFSLKFEDQSGKKYTRTYDLGTKCPSEVAFEIGPGMSVSERQVRP